jgi:hypothetical protein
MAFYGKGDFKISGTIVYPENPTVQKTRTFSYAGRKYLAKYEYNIEEKIEQKTIDGKIHVTVLGARHRFGLTLYFPTREEYDLLINYQDSPYAIVFYPHDDNLDQSFPVNVLRVAPVYDKNNINLIAILLVLETNDFENLNAIPDEIPLNEEKPEEQILGKA